MNDNQHPVDQVLAEVGAILVKEWASIPVHIQGAIQSRLDAHTWPEFLQLLRENGVAWVPRAVS